MDAESAHNLALWAISTEILNVQIPKNKRLETKAFGKTLQHPVGLAAGFDKNACAINGFAQLGFSFIEVGTATPLAQEGNPKPRIFRLPHAQAIVNRLGFNNQGIENLMNNIEASQPTIPLGINIGKNKNTPNENALNDYAKCLKKTKKLADYLVVNVSSPNTPGLRNLQDPSKLKYLLTALREIANNTKLFVKIAPDLSDEHLRTIVETTIECKFNGIVAVNTTTQKPDIQLPFERENGGLSGAPLRATALEITRKIREICGNSLEIIGVGGIFTGNDVFERLKAGANACQIYTALIYRGPFAVPKILQELLQIMDEAGIENITEL